MAGKKNFVVTKWQCQTCKAQFATRALYDSHFAPRKVCKTTKAKRDAVQAAAAAAAAAAAVDAAAREAAARARRLRR